MSTPFFANIPIINYQGTQVRDILKKSQFFKSVLDNYNAFYPYTVLDEDRADLIAFHYYGSWEYDWLVYFSNQMLDPYFDWVPTQDQFDKYLMKKYGSFENALETIHHYRYDRSVDPADAEADYKDGYEMTPDTFSLLTNIQKSFWKPVYAYEWESEINEAKRNIKLIDNRLLNQIDREITTIFRGR